MGFFSSLFGRLESQPPGRFDSDDAYQLNRARQLAGAPEVLTQLRNYGVTDKSQLKLEYFFYTNAPDKAAALATQLAELGYSGRADRSASDEKIYVVTGWTPRMRMDQSTVLAWAGRMCDVGHEHDCEFDGWGTNPQQP